MKKIIVTGGSGRLGQYVLREFIDQGYEVVNVDVKQPDQDVCRTVIVDLTNLGQVYGVIKGAYGVVHLAAIPVAYSHPNEVTFKNNVMGTYNILEAVAGLGISKVVIASSESSYGFCFAKQAFSPLYLPLDEAHPQLPQDSYGLSKVIGEEMAATFNRRTGMQVISLRLGNVITPQMYPDFIKVVNDPTQKVTNLWNYIDARDAASACRLAIEAENLGAINLNVVANDNAMDIKSLDLIKAGYPEVKDIRTTFKGYETLMTNTKAKELLNWNPTHYWRDQV